ncbi:DMT family transporter [Aetokthonos hydrillicola Thurmond2011]|jgi:drug/metabolite transporter (DMT)-like permease|uniref:DMT family transporter n=1 Tax=Aetokthonos hydrillicola Thurmond2011 TaxID=2712845 RepID=A0AAP5IDX0_9CYAN|nr:DMT family transporter [Aetokthonos hydrillicola]MBO3463238.1 DMT family transporter [Aetokthonos hydrillicola CCALA 1050]MBW4590711.1 DMT family transporter [Aetokthonos hydrillicola CCALA 1050]MDR9899843.1 DMT family transporter [Aetokthonos hydrillicola Thurmond2011]
MLKAKLKLSYEQLLAAPTTIALASLVVSLVALSFSPILIRLSEGELGPNATIFNRFWISTIAFTMWNGFTTVRQQLSDNQPQEPQPYTIRQLLLLLGVGFVMFATLALWAWSLAHTTVANSTLMHNLAPLFTVLGGWLFWGKRFDTKFLSGMLVAIAGACLLAYHDFSSAGDKLQGDIAALLSAGFLGLYPLLVEQLRTQFSPITIMTWCSVIGTVLLLPIVILTEDKLFPYSLQEWIYVTFLALICQILGLVLYAYSLRKLSSGFVSLCDLFVPVLSTQEAWLLFSEKPSWVTFVSFAVILLGVYVTSTSQSAIKGEVESAN